MSIADQCIRWLPGITVSRLAILPTPITGAMYKGDVGRDIVTTQLKHVYISSLADHSSCRTLTGLVKKQVSLELSHFLLSDTR